MPLFAWVNMLRSRHDHQHAKMSARPKVTIISERDIDHQLNHILEDRPKLQWMVAIAGDENGEIYFYDTGGDIITDLGRLEYIKARCLRETFEDDDDRD